MAHGNGRNGRFGKNGNGNGGNGLTTTIRYKNEQGDFMEQEVATYKGLLSMAHEDGLRRLDTKLIQIPTEANGMTAIAEAEVETLKGVFHAIGDANPGNVNRRIAPHVIRMAETRAKARALRDAVNIGTVALEELGDLGNGEIAGEAGASGSRQAPASRIPQGQNRGNGANGKSGTTESTGTKPQNGNDQDAGNEYEPALMTEAQRRYLFRLLAMRGVNGPIATERLQAAFRTEDLKRVSKADASALIEKLKAEQAPAAATGNGGGQ